MWGLRMDLPMHLDSKLRVKKQEVRGKMQEERCKRKDARGKVFLTSGFLLLASCFLLLVSCFLFLAYAQNIDPKERVPTGLNPHDQIDDEGYILRGCILEESGLAQQCMASPGRLTTG